MKSKLNKPLVTIIVPVYNGEKYLYQCIESINDQTYKNLEVIIIDDNSHNKNYINDIISKFKSLKFKFIQLSKNQGVANAMNEGLKNSSGKFINWLSHDDLFHPLKIQKQLEDIDYDDTTISYCNFVLFNDQIDKQRVIKPLKFPKNYIDFWLLFNDKLHGCSLLIPRRFFEKSFFDVSLIHTQDYDKWYEFSLIYPFKYLDKNYLFSRDHDNQGSKLFNYDSYQERQQLYKKILINNFKIRNGKIDLKILLKLYFSMNFRGNTFINNLLFFNKINDKKISKNPYKSFILKLIIISTYPLILTSYYFKLFIKKLLKITSIYV